LQDSHPSPDEVLSALKHDATPRMRRSLDIIQTLCSEQHQRGSRDFSVATIGRLSSARGGPATQTIRNKYGEHYRTLLVAWAAFADGQTRKPPAKVYSGTAEDVLGMIDDAAVRAIVGVIMAENRKLKGENTLLKSQAQITVDRRRLPEPTPALSMPTLLPVEKEALSQAISEEFLRVQGWQIDTKTGRVTSTKDGRPIFTAGFATAIKKVLDSCGNQ
jgi:hypothetical protein